MRNYFLILLACLSCACASLSVPDHSGDFPGWFPRECIDTMDPWECESNHAD